MRRGTGPARPAKRVPLSAGQRRMWLRAEAEAARPAKTYAGVLLDLAAHMLPALVLVAYIDYAAWMAWWI